MARKARPWFRTGRGWCVVVRGRIVPLGVADPADESGAWAAWDRLRKGLPGAAADPTATVAQQVPRFLSAAATRVKTRTVRNYAHYLSRFLAAFGREPVGGLDPAGIERWAADQPWSPTNRANYLWTVQAFLRWCGAPVNLAKPPKASRAADSVIPRDVYAACLRETSGDFHQLVRFLWATGCRPSEAAALTAGHVRWDAGVAVLEQHKTSHRTNKARVIYLAGESLDVAQQQRAKYPAGLLFRTHRGTGFSPQAYTMRFQRLSGKVGHKVTGYMFRHSFCSRALGAGESDAVVAMLMGHASTAMVWKHYAHANALGRELKAAADTLPVALPHTPPTRYPDQHGPDCSTAAIR